MWYIHTREYYSVVTKNEIMPSAAMGMCLEVVILSEVSQRQIPHVIACMWHLEQWYKWNYLWDRNRLRHRKQTYGYQKEWKHVN